MFIKDVFRLIKTTKKRFFAIAAIVFIGVAFMFGLLANTDIMRISVDEYIKNNNLQDIQIYSNYGFDYSDINAIQSLDNVDKVFASRTRDVFEISNNNETHVIRVRELQPVINKIELIEGKNPEKEDECLYIDNGIGLYKIGDEISLYLEDEDLNESLINTKYTVCGIAKCPKYMSKMLSTSLVNNLDLDAVICIPSSNFISEYYTTIELTVKKNNNYSVLDDEYYDYIESEKKKIENFSKIQQYKLKNTIVSNAQIEIADAQKKLKDAQIDGQKEIDDAKKDLDKAKQDISDAQKEIDDNRIKLIDAQKEIDDGYKEVNNNRIIINNQISAIETSSGKTFNTLKTEVSTAYTSLVTLKNNKQIIENNIIELDTNKTNCENLITINHDLLLPDELNKTNIQNKLATIDPITQDDLYQKLIVLDQAFDFLVSYDSNKAALETNKATIETSISTIIASFGSEEILNDTYSNLMLVDAAINQLNDAEKELNKAQEEVDDGYIELENGIKELENGKKEYNEGLLEYYDSVDEFEKEITDAQKEIDDAIQEINDLDDPKWIVLDNNSLYSIVMYRNSCDQMNAIGIVIPIMFFLVAALVCSTTMKRLIDEQRSQIGIYVALGYSNTSIVWRYLSYVIVASLFSSIIALFVGVYLFPTIIYTTWRLLYNLPSIHIIFPNDKLIICVLSFIILICLVSYYEIIQSLKECPASLMRPKPPKNTKKIMLERIKILWNRLSFTSKITARNVFRYKSRFLMTVLGVAGCTGLLILGFGIRDSISDVVNNQYNDLYQHNYVINLEEDCNISDVLNELTKIEEIDKYSTYQTYSSKTINSNNKESTINAIVIDKQGLDDIYNLEDYKNNTKLSLNDDGVIISEKYSINENLNVGDKITISSSEGVEKEVSIIAITKMYFQHYMYLTPELYENTFNEEYVPNCIGVNNVGNNDNLMKLIDLDLKIVSINDFSSFIDNFELMIRALDLIILVIIITSGALAFVVLINLINVNVSERIREIATLKVLGFRDNEVNAYLFKEIILLSLIGSIIGLPLGRIETRFVMSVINVDMIMFPIDIKLLSYVLGFVITMVFTIIVLIFTRKTLRKIQMVESLKSIE